jgi:hypothetical protein
VPPRLGGHVREPPHLLSISDDLNKAQKENREGERARLAPGSPAPSGQMAKRFASSKGHRGFGAGGMIPGRGRARRRPGQGTLAL